MSTLLLICGLVLGLIVLVLRSLALDEVRGRISRRTDASVERTIASMPPELQAEWADEWRGELAAIRAMPFSSLALARNLRKTAAQLVAASELATAGPGSATVPGGRQRKRRSLTGTDRAAAMVARLRSRVTRKLDTRRQTAIVFIVLAVVQLAVAAATLLLGRSLPTLIFGGVSIVIALVANSYVLIDRHKEH